MDPNPRETLQAVRNRDPETITLLVREHHRRLRGYVAALSADLEHVDDLAQEVFLRALERLDRVQDLEDFGGFLRGIARNVVREHGRRRGRDSQRFVEFIDQLHAAPEDAVEQAPGDVAALRRCLESLAPRSRRVLDLRYAEERRADEIGREMRMNPGAVRVLLLRIRETLLKCMRAAALEAGR
jgi:RNA polymerase sigma-70 factor (ECF subfamily)